MPAVRLQHSRQWSAPWSPTSPAVVINYGDFARFVKDERQMRIGNFFGLPVSLAVFSIIALVITAGTVVVFGDADQPDRHRGTHRQCHPDGRRRDHLLRALRWASTWSPTSSLRPTTSPTWPRQDQRRTGGFITAAIAFSSARCGWPSSAKWASPPLSIRWARRWRRCTASSWRTTTWSGVSVWMYSSCSAPNVPASITSTLAGTARQ